MTTLLVNASALEIPLPDGSVHCAICSPPYWGLRDYGIAPRAWGGEASCRHEWGGELPPRPGRGNAPGNFPTSSLTNPKRQDSLPRPSSAGAFCEKCGAWLGSLGLEPSVDLYVEHMVQVFREIWRVLRPDGSLWLNLGDAYANDGKRGGESAGKQSYLPDADRKRNGRERRSTGLKPKSLIGMPWRIALALQEDGWILRSDIIWSKVNPLPESVKDRVTRSHEYLFLLVKSRFYFYDQEAIKEPSSQKSHSRGKGVNPKALKIPSGWDTGPGRHDKKRPRQNPSWSKSVRHVVPTRNKRSVWTTTTQPVKSAHFATFPPALITPCILAGTSGKGVCPRCKAPWVRVVRREGKTGHKDYSGKWRGATQMSSGRRMLASVRHGREQGLPHDQPFLPLTTLGWRPSCRCYGDFYRRDFVTSLLFEQGIPRRVRMMPVPFDWPAEPAVVLDPFIGSGTTAMAAEAHGRDCIGLDLSFDYLSSICKERVAEGLKPKMVKPGSKKDPPMQLSLIPEERECQIRNCIA